MYVLLILSAKPNCYASKKSPGCQPGFFMNLEKELLKADQLLFMFWL